MQPTVIFALPRSRTAWLARWLGFEHDIAPRADSVQDFLDVLSRARGTVETGASGAHTLIRTAFPQAKFITVRRNRVDVAQSLARFGVSGVETELARRETELDQIEDAGALRVEYNELSDVNCCADLEQLATGVEFSYRRWREFAGQNIQIDVCHQLKTIAARAAPIAALKTEVAQLVAKVAAGHWPRLAAIRPEPILEFWPEAEALATNHHREVNNGEPSQRLFRLDLPLVHQLEKAGGFVVYAARVDGIPAGYCTWSVGPDTECAGTTAADQGAWYVAPEFDGMGLGRKLLLRAKQDFAALGITRLHLHHQLHGRGARAGVLFKRLGAEPLQHRYVLEL